MVRTAFLSMAVAAGLAVGFGGGCVVYPAGPVVAEGDVEVAGPPPMVMDEAVSPSPGSGYVWIGGAWDWRGRWVWDKGRWERPPHPGAIWVPHRYVEHDGKRTFIRGRWR